MTNQLLRMTARGIAGKFYEGEITELTGRFRMENPDQDIYVAQHWPHFVQLAKEQLGQLLTAENVSEHEKMAIMEELIDHAERSQSHHAREVLQVKSQPREREDVRHVDNNPQLLRARA